MKSIRDHAEKVEYAEPQGKGLWHRPRNDRKYKKNWDKIDWRRK